MFRKFLASVGVGGATVETVLESDTVMVGRDLAGLVIVSGGSVPQQVDDVVLELLTRVEHESGGSSRHQAFEIVHWRAGARLVLDPGSHHELPFRVMLPFHTPLYVGGPANVWLRTRLDLPMAVDASDEDPFRVLPSPRMADVFLAMERLGFALAKSDVEYRPHWHGGHGFVQEFEFRPASRGYRRYDEVEIVFEGESDDGLMVLMQVDRAARGLMGAMLEATGRDESWYRIAIPPGGPMQVAATLREVLG